MEFQQFIGFIIFLTVFTMGFWMLLFLLSFVVPYWLFGYFKEEAKLRREAKKKNK
jgi:protein-S-isoprenylcysteine O-methyltransferase Ste14